MAAAPGYPAHRARGDGARQAVGGGAKRVKGPEQDAPGGTEGGGPARGGRIEAGLGERRRRTGKTERRGLGGRSEAGRGKGA